MTTRRLLLLMALAALLAGGGAGWLTAATADEQTGRSPATPSTSTTEVVEVETPTPTAVSTTPAPAAGGTTPPSLRNPVTTTTTEAYVAPAQAFDGVNCGPLDPVNPTADLIIVTTDQMSCDDASFSLTKWRDPESQGPNLQFDCTDGADLDDFLVACGTKDETGDVLTRSRVFVVARPLATGD